MPFIIILHYVEVYGIFVALS